MYKLGRRSGHHQIIILTIATLVVLALVFVGFKILANNVSPRTRIQNSPPITKSYSPDSAAKVHIDAAKFSLDLPAGWSRISSASDVYKPYSYQSGGDGTEILSVYIDNLPLTLAVNRVLSVQALGSHIAHDTVSDNCVNFLPPNSLDSPQAKQTGVVQAKWQGVDFYCDVGNYPRDVVGTSSLIGANKLTLTGASGVHNLFFTYTDNSINPDYTTFYNILDSFEVK